MTDSEIIERPAEFMGWEKEPCEQCGGEGQQVVGENLITMDMAIDAGDRSLEGSHHSYAYGECDACMATGIKHRDGTPSKTGTTGEAFASVLDNR